MHMILPGQMTPVVPPRIQAAQSFLFSDAVTELQGNLKLMNQTRDAAYRLLRDYFMGETDALPANVEAAAGPGQETSQFFKMPYPFFQA